MTILYAFLFAIIFSIFDFFGYQYASRRGLTEGLLAPYRIVQGSVQILLTATCFYFFGWAAALGFFLLWWTWNCDLMYYFIYDITKLYGSGAFKNEVLGNKVSWAWWTAYGLVDLWINGKDPKTNYYRVINGSILLFQAFLGILTVIFIGLI